MPEKCSHKSKLMLLYTLEGGWMVLDRFHFVFIPWPRCFFCLLVLNEWVYSAYRRQLQTSIPPFILMFSPTAIALWPHCIDFHYTHSSKRASVASVFMKMLNVAQRRGRRCSASPEIIITTNLIQVLHWCCLEVQLRDVNHYTMWTNVSLLIQC